MNLRLFLVICFLLTAFFSNAQDKDRMMDSLQNAYQNAGHDTTRCAVLEQMIEAEMDDRVWPQYNEEMRRLAEAGLKEYPPAHPLHKKFKYYLGYAIGNQGYLAQSRNNVDQSMKYFLTALQIQREINDLEGQAVTYNNMGWNYTNQQDFEKAMACYKKAEELHLKGNNYSGLSSTLLNIGTVYSDIGQPDEAIDYYSRSLVLAQKVNDHESVVYCLNLIAQHYNDLKSFESALDYATRAMKQSRENNYDDGIGFSHYTLGLIYDRKKEPRKALLHAHETYRIAKHSGALESIEKATTLLVSVYEALGDKNKALEFYKIGAQTKDSIRNSSTLRMGTEVFYEIEYQKRAAADSVKAQEEKKIADAQMAESNALLQQEKTKSYALYGGLALVLVFALFMFNRFRVAKKQRIILEQKEKDAQQQKKLVLEKQKEIIDSITYAKRIQNAILAREEEIMKNFPQSFLYYKPKDIVAGDFYFFETTDTHVFYAAADCTGHGVPGALVSIVCSSALTRCIKEFGLTDPGKILDKTRELVLETFHKSGQDVKDGMDISLISLRFNVQSSMSTLNIKPETLNVELQWAGANNPLWIIRHNGNFESIEADKRSIGLGEDAGPFTTHTVKLGQGDEIILFTDGYAGQPGGDKGEEFKEKKLALLVSNQVTLPMEKQLRNLEQTFEKWRGGYEQVDDVCVIGIRM